MPRAPLVKAPTLTRNGKVVGRPRREPPPNAAEVIRETAAHGNTIRGCAVALGVRDEVMKRWLAENPKLMEAFEAGREKERQTLHQVLYETATKGSGKDAMIAAMFLLKSRHGYREGEQEQQASRVHIELKLPAALPPAQYAEVVHHG